MAKRPLPKESFRKPIVNSQAANQTPPDKTCVSTLILLMLSCVTCKYVNCTPLQEKLKEWNFSVKMLFPIDN